ncbi:MAG: hypothetical protein M9895_14575 [Aquamicrobium sp.]|uniref:hypothetical protein n=1 Tax=Aquamicrobium sp. TaxID=1872579 RepID=UPI00349E70AE|nr:hypothetical protein [Aquamicrobium sp.]MCO5157754.1 hypothetical protein [Aquamicrobium sp.]
MLLLGHSKVLSNGSIAYFREGHFSGGRPIADYAASSGLGEEIARPVITRTDISRPAVIPEDRQLLLNWGNLYKDFGTIPADADLEKIVDELLVYDLFKVAE